MVSFEYTCGVLGGILVDEPEEESAAAMPDVNLQEMSNAAKGDHGTAMIYYAFDNTVNSSRYPYYSYMKGFWTAMGLHTRIDTTVTVSDLKRMNDYGLCILRFLRPHGESAPKQALPRPAAAAVPRRQPAGTTHFCARLRKFFPQIFSSCDNSAKYLPQP